VIKGKKTMAKKRKSIAKLFVPIIKTKIIESLANGGTITGACSLAGVTTKTYYEWRKKANEGLKSYEDFFNEIEKRKQEVADDLFHGIKKLSDHEIIKVDGKEHLIKGDWRAKAWLLKRLNPEVFNLNKIAKEENEDNNNNDDLLDLKKFIHVKD
jgi:hypothetical protein